MTPSPRDFLSGARSVGVVVDPDSGREVEAYAYPGAVLLVTNRCTMEEVMGKPSARAAVRLYNKARELAQTLTLTKEITAPWADLIDEDLAKRGRWSWDLLLWVSRTGKSRLKERNHLPTLDMFRSNS